MPGMRQRCDYIDREAESMKFDCESCAKRTTCEDAQAGTFCIAWCSKLPDDDRKDPSPDGWEDD